MDKALILAILSGVATLIISFKLFFRDRYDFWECIKYYLTPDIISAFRGDWKHDIWAEATLFVWFALAGFTAFLVYISI